MSFITPQSKRPATISALLWEEKKDGVCGKKGRAGSETPFQNKGGNGGPPTTTLADISYGGVGLWQTLTSLAKNWMHLHKKKENLGACLQLW